MTEDEIKAMPIGTVYYRIRTSDERIDKYEHAGYGWYQRRFRAITACGKKYGAVRLLYPTLEQAIEGLEVAIGDDILKRVEDLHARMDSLVEELENLPEIDPEVAELRPASPLFIQSLRSHNGWSFVEPEPEE